MTATNVNATVIPIGIGGNVEGYKMGWLVGVAKAAQNDTITVTNAKIVLGPLLRTAAGVLETCTVTGTSNVITCTSANPSLVLTGVILYKEF